jgi:integrase
METDSEKKKIVVKYHGHEWPVYPLTCRGTTLFRVIHRVNGERRPKTFTTLAKAEADALSILKEIYAKGEPKIHLTDDEKRDWHAAVAVLKQAGIRSSLETVCRSYADLSKIVGGASLLTDVARKYAASRGKAVVPVKLTVLREAYVSALKKKNCSVRHVNAQRSHTGQFVAHAGENTKSDRITRELLQDFVDAKKKADPRTKKNLLDAVKAMMAFGQSNRQVPLEWEEADHVVLPTVKAKKIRVFTPEELTRLFAAAPQDFRPILALAAFAGIRSSEIECLDWKHIRLAEKEAKDRLIVMDVDVTEESGKRFIPIGETLWKWLAPGFKSHGNVWRGSHDDFYRTQQTIAKTAGIRWKNNALRHTAISAQVAITRDVPEVAFHSGNSVDVIKRHYLDLMTPSTAEAWFAVNPLAVYNFEQELKAEATQNRQTPVRGEGHALSTPDTGISPTTTPVKDAA